MTGEATLFDLDPRRHARRTDPDTSAAAAHQLAPKVAMMRRLLAEFAREPLTAEEASDLAGYGPADGAWKRVSDLVRAGLIADTGYRRRARSGRSQIVRAITIEGMQEYRGQRPIGRGRL